MPVKIVKRDNEKESPAELNDRGMLYLSRGMLNEAEEYFKQAIELDPDYPIAYNNLAVVYLRRGFYKDAVKELRVATQLKPDYAEAYNNLGVAYFQLQKYTEAKWSFEKAISINPNYAEPQKNLEILSQKLIISTGKNDAKRLTSKSYTKKNKKKLPTISLCMIVKNEEEHLPKALNSVKDAVDEIIIVDTGSTDNTVEIAKSFGAKVYYYEWNNDFASARNETLKYATCDWILSMDADDEMNADDIRRLKEVLSETDAMGFAIPIFSEIYDRQTNMKNTTVNYLVRIFKNDPRIRFSRRIHEFVDQSIYDIGGKIEILEIPVFHRGYIDLETLNKKLERNKRLLEVALEENPEDHSLLVYMGKTYLEENELDKAEEYYKRAISLVETGSKRYASLFFLQTAYIGLGNLLIQKGEFEEAIEYFNKAIAIDPNFPDTYYHIGMAYYNKGRFEEAYNMFSKVFEVDVNKSTAKISHLGIRGELTLTMLQATALQLGMYREAIEYGTKVLEINPQNAPVLNNMGIAYIALGERELGREYFEKALLASPGFIKALDNLERCFKEEFGMTSKV
jgi:tetratricopeptide (TPR) repeat protein